MFTLTRPRSLSTHNTRLTRKKISAASVLGCTGQLVSMEPASRPSPVCKLRRRPWTVCAVDITKCRLKKSNPRCVLFYISCTITKEGASLGVCAYDKCGNCRESKTNISIRMKIKSVAVQKFVLYRGVASIGFAHDGPYLQQQQHLHRLRVTPRTCRYQLPQPCNTPRTHQQQMEKPSRRQECSSTTTHREPSTSEQSNK